MYHNDPNGLSNDNNQFIYLPYVYLQWNVGLVLKNVLYGNHDIEMSRFMYRWYI